jgi:hypothetical protein
MMSWHTAGYKDWFQVTMEPNFTVEILKPASRLIFDFDVAGDEVANLIADQWGHKPLYLTMSGGLDSEFVADRLIKNKIEFTPVIVKLEQLNSLETWYAEYWCYKNNKTPVVIDFTLDQYTDAMKKFAPQCAELKNFNLALQIIVYDYVNQHQGHLIYCAGDMQFDINSKDLFYLHSFDLISSIASVGQHPTSFYMHTPELLLSYISGYNIVLSENYNKINAYGISPRPKIPYQQLLADDPRWFELKHHLSTEFGVPVETQHKPCHLGTREQIIKKLTT